MMNLPRSKKFPASRRPGIALLALMLGLAVGAHAANEQRWLFVFNTSAGMKKRLPAVETQIRTLLAKDFAGSLHAGDSVGVWTLDDKLHMGKFPLITWEPKQAGQLATNLVTFIHKQSYSGNTSFDALQPTLGSVIDDSERLTVVIVCDGESEIHWTPYNDGINETMKQTRDDRKKLLLPYVIVLRTQLGKYVGATVNFPPIPSNLPPFPLLPREIKAIPAPLPPPVVVAKVAPPAPPLIIVGTHVSSDTNDINKMAQAAATNPPAPEKINESNAPVAAATVPVPVPPATKAAATNMVARGVPPPVVVVTNVVAVTNIMTAPVSEDRDTKILTYIGGGLLAAAVALVVFLATRRSAPRGSLITSSMHGDPRPPEKK